MNIRQRLVHLRHVREYRVFLEQLIAFHLRSGGGFDTQAQRHVAELKLLQRSRLVTLWWLLTGRGDALIQRCNAVMQAFLTVMSIPSDHAQRFELTDCLYKKL